MGMEWPSAGNQWRRLQSRKSLRMDRDIVIGSMSRGSKGQAASETSILRQLRLRRTRRGRVLFRPGGCASHTTPYCGARVAPRRDSFRRFHAHANHGCGAGAEKHRPAYDLRFLPVTGW